MATQQIRDALLVLSSRVGYVTEMQQRAVEEAITNYFADAPAVAGTEVALTSSSPDLSTKVGDSTP